MMMIYLISGLFVLSLAAKYLVDAAVVVAQKFNLSNAVIGLTVVAAGTSLPELITSVVAAINGQSDIAIGNVMGSNIFNVLGILGLTGLITHTVISKEAKSVEIPIMLASYVVFLILAFDQNISRFDGFVLFALMVSFMTISVKRAKDNSSSKHMVGNKVFYKNLGLLILSFVGLIVGADLALKGGILLGQWAGLSERVIGVTIIAVGTSLPEIGASISAALKGEKEMAVANVVGSNIFNTLGILGVTALVQPINLSLGALKEDMAVMIGSGLVLLVLSLVKKEFFRKEGFMFLILMSCYFGYLIIK